MNKSILWFVGAFTFTLGPLVAAAPNWIWFASPLGVGSVLSTIGGVLVAAYGINLKKPPVDPTVN